MEENKPNLTDTAPNADEAKAVQSVAQEAQTTSPLDTDFENGQSSEMKDVLRTINDDLEAPQGLTQEEIDAKKKQQLLETRKNEIRKKTLGDNASRVASNGLSRVAIFSTVAAIVVGGSAFMYFSSNDESVQSDLSGSVDLPKANVAGNATLTKEQAEFERKNQQNQASNAEQNGETYIPSVIVERDADQQYLVGDGVVPGVKVEVDANGRPVTNNFADAGFDPALAHNGGASTSASDGTRGAPANNFNNGNGGQQYNNGQQQANNGNQNQPAPLTATIPQDKYASNIAALDQAGKNVEDWQNGIANSWLKKAAQTEEVAQTAFTDQLANLLSTKPKRDGASVGNSNRHVQYAYVSTNKDGKSGNSTGGSSANAPYSNQVQLHQNSGSNGGSSASNTNQQVYIRAGTNYVTQLISEVNTDEGVEVLARIANGPYKDAQLIGVVKQANKNIQFVFTRLIPKKGPELSIEAVAREVGTNKLGMADDIQTHTFKRYAGMVLSSGMQGYGEAWSDVGTTTSNGFGTTQTKTKPNDREIAGKIVGEMGESVSQDIIKRTTQPTTYITYSGKVFNLYFNKNVTEVANK